MSDYKHEPEDFDDDQSESMSAASDTTSGSSRDFTDVIGSDGLKLLPLTILAVYAFVERAVVLTAIEGLIGSTGLATALTSAMYIAGAITVSLLGALVVIAAIGLLAGLVRLEGGPVIISVLIVAGLGVLYAGANLVFTGVPLLVGAVLTLNAVVYGAVALTALIVGVIAISTM